MIKRYHNCYICFLNLIKAGFFKLLVQSTSAVLKQYIESVFRVCIAWYKHERGLGEFLTVMQTRLRRLGFA